MVPILARDRAATAPFVAQNFLNGRPRAFCVTVRRCTWHRRVHRVSNILTRARDL